MIKKISRTHLCKQHDTVAVRTSNLLSDSSGKRWFYKQDSQSAKSAQTLQPAHSKKDHVRTLLPEKASSVDTNFWKFRKLFHGRTRGRSRTTYLLKCCTVWSILGHHILLAWRVRKPWQILRTLLFGSKQVLFFGRRPHSHHSNGAGWKIILVSVIRLLSANPRYPLFIQPSNPMRFSLADNR